ncbi:MAG: hypothetical protein JWR52_331 [Marmoricola sp.]|nr:hypothetical protein [Marmoricola sp.]
MTTSDLDPVQRRQIISDVLAVAVATGAYGISFGAIAATMASTRPWVARSWRCCGRG